MDRPQVEFHPEAVLEALSAREWYESRNPAAAEAFVAELDSAIEQISRAPTIWPAYLNGTRHSFYRFPYVAVYREIAGQIQILAIAHARRKRGYWRDR